MFQRRDKNTFIDNHWKKIYRLQRPPNRNYIHETGGLHQDGEDHFIYKFKLKMANTISVMTNVLRNAVSKQRIRYKGNGFNLDLAYICDNIIAMGYPADNIESIYRNRLEDVYKFLEEHHQGHYKIYNLCLERSYDKNKFHGRVSVYPFEDHNPPTIELIQKFCNDVNTWLKTDGQNVAAVHCKAGKGRTGTMICCYLLFSGQRNTAEDALAYYAEKRTKDGKGVTIPSQRRYVQYFFKLLQSKGIYEKQTLQFCEIRFMEANALYNHGTVHCSISALLDTPCGVKVETLRIMCLDFRKGFTLDLRNSGLEVTGDIKVELNSKTTRKKIFHFWVNTYFIVNANEIEGKGEDARYIYTLNKPEIDDAHKDKDHKCYPEDFQIQLVFYKDPPRHRISNSGNNDVSHMLMGGRNYITQNSHSSTTSVATAATNAALMTQHSNSGCELNYHCDQRSSSSSASVSSLVGGNGSGSGSGCGNDSGSGSTKFNKAADNYKRSSINNVPTSNTDIKLNPMNTVYRNVGGLNNDEVGAESLVQTSFGEYRKYVIPKNVFGGEQMILDQLYAHHKWQQQSSSYQPSESNIAAVSPSKGTRGSKINNFQNNHVAKDAANHTNFGGGCAKALNGIQKRHATTAVAATAAAGDENEHHDNYFDVEHDIEDDDTEDWESGESAAKSLQHNIHLTYTTTTPTTTKTKTTTPLNKTTQLPQLISSPLTSTTTTTISTSTFTTIPTPTLTNTTHSTTMTARTVNMYHNHQSSTSSSQKLIDPPSMNLAPLTNTSTSSNRSYSFRAEIGGDNNGNNYLNYVVNDDIGDISGDDDKHIVQENFLSKSNEPISNSDSTEAAPAATAAAAAHKIPYSENICSDSSIRGRTLAAGTVPRNKFFSNKFWHSNAKTTMSLTMTTTTETAASTAITTTPPKQPFFRRKSFKSAASNGSIAGGGKSCDGTDPTSANTANDTTASCGGSGLAALSKQKLKMKLKKNRFKLAQKFQKLQNYLRSDPDDFCENFAKQTIVMRRNSNCSMSSRNHKTLPQSAKLSVSPELNSKIDNEKTDPASFEQLAKDSTISTLPAAITYSSSSLSPSGTASNASLVSSAGCDVSCIGDDYYSSVCDNQLSFNNSPCKSPRSLADDTSLSVCGPFSIGNADTVARSLNSPNSLELTTQQRLQQLHHNQYQRLPFQVNSKNSGNSRQQRINDVVVVAAKPAKTHAIGFNVSQSPLCPSDCVDGVTTSPSNGFLNISRPNSSNGEADNSISSVRSSVYFTPPTSESIENEIFDSCCGNELHNSSAISPFVFPAIANELSNISQNESMKSSCHSGGGGGSGGGVAALNLLIFEKNNANNGGLQLNKSKTPSTDEASLESIDNVGDNSATDHGNNTGSGFSTSDCCTNSSSSSSGVCNCNPLVIDLERYAARNCSKTTTNEADEDDIGKTLKQNTGDVTNEITNSVDKKQKTAVGIGTTKINL